MAHSGTMLAATEGLGRVYDCGNCGNIHIQLGAVTITLEPEAYMQLVAMISLSAANFELWLEQRREAMEEHRIEEHRGDAD